MAYLVLAIYFIFEILINYSCRGEYGNAWCMGYPSVSIFITIFWTLMGINLYACFIKKWKLLYLLLSILILPVALYINSLFSDLYY
jgi:hypothetical protein